MQNGKSKKKTVTFNEANAYNILTAINKADLQLLTAKYADLQGEKIMINCFGLPDNNCYLWLLIVVFLCCGGCGCIGNIVDKLCGCGALLPLLLVLLCCCGGDKPPREPKFPGCGCK